jgi:hypothetical protein
MFESFQVLTYIRICKMRCKYQQWTDKYVNRNPDRTSSNLSDLIFSCHRQEDTWFLTLRQIRSKSKDWQTKHLKNSKSLTTNGTCMFWILFMRGAIDVCYITDIYIMIYIKENKTSLFTAWDRQLYHGGQYPAKTTDLPQVTDKLYHIMLYRVHIAWSGFELKRLVVVGTDLIDTSFKYRYINLNSDIFLFSTYF